MVGSHLMGNICTNAIPITCFTNYGASHRKVSLMFIMFCGLFFRMLKQILDAGSWQFFSSYNGQCDFTHFRVRLALWSLNCYDILSWKLIYKSSIIFLAAEMLP